MENTSVRTFATSSFISAALCACLIVTSPLHAQESSAAQKSPPNDGPDGHSIYDSLMLRDPALKTPPKKALEAHGKRYALCVGVGQASVNGIEQHPLPMCINDAKTLGALLENVGYTSVVLTDDAPDDLHKPTVANAVAALNDVCSAAGHDDQLVLYFSTHGGYVDQKPQLVMQDGLLELETIKQMAAHSGALVRIIMLDACRVEGSGFRTESNECRDVHVILACRPDQESNGGKNGLSIFTEALIDGLTGCAADRVKDGRIELDELLYYIEDAMPKLLERDWPGVEQNPTRTVVDARAINPVLLACEKPLDADAGAGEPDPEAEDEASVIGVYEPTTSSLRSDLILPSGIAGKITMGMTVAEVREAMGDLKPAIDFGDDPTADDLVQYENTPKPGDSLWVLFTKGKVSSVIVMQQETGCDGAFDREEACRGARRLIAGKPAEEWESAYVGLTKAQVKALMGCPSSVTAADTGKAFTVWTYKTVPVMLLDTSLRFEDDRVASVVSTPSADEP